MTLQEQIAVMQAFADGKRIEYSRDGTRWGYSSNHQWNWSDYTYRIKPEHGFIYPMWFQNTNQHLIVRFDSLGNGEVIKSTIDLYKIGDYSQTWVYHTDKNTWKQVLEPKPTQQITLLECIKAPTDLGRYSSEWLTQEQYDATRPGVYIKVLRVITI